MDYITKLEEELQYNGVQSQSNEPNWASNHKQN
jgi:hypothetical protein